MNILLVSPYELGRQPFGLAQPAAWLREAGHEVTCLDLSLQRLEPGLLARADLVGLYVAMHTATRIAMEALPRIRAAAPGAHLCAYGLYAPVNEAGLRAAGVGTVLGGEFEPGLASLAARLATGDGGAQVEPVVELGKIAFRPPDRSGLPPLDAYAHLVVPGGEPRTVGFAEGSRGCKHLCRHCPVVPVYRGRFRIVPADVVLADVRAQVAAGARHVSFGDPDFFNGPTHALRLARGLHAEHPGVTFDATIKVEHLLAHRTLLPELRDAGCLFVISAVESVDDAVLAHLDKGHTAADFEAAVALLRDTGIALSPTFMPFTPWTTLEGYRALLATLVRLELVEAVAPVQLSIRLLVPEGSRLLEHEGFAGLVDDFDPATLGYPWRHADPRVDDLHARVQALVEAAEAEGRSRAGTFAGVWALAHEAAGLDPPALPEHLGEPVPHHSEPWYCCAEPTSQQLAAV